MKYHLFLYAATLLTSCYAIGNAATVPMSADRWETQGSVSFETYDGREAMRMGAPVTGPRQGGVANIKAIDFKTGIIEFDMLLPDLMEFSGPLFHQPDENTGEYIYLRPHLNGKPDSIQYTPVVNGNLAWQIFTGPGFEAQATFPLGRWTRVRLDVFERSARVSVDGKPVLHIPDLKNGPLSGAVGFASLMGGTYYSNVTVEAIPDYRDPTPTPSVTPLANGTIATWQVSEALTQEAAFMRAERSDWAGVPWHSIEVESNGIANLSKAGPDGDDEHSFIARFSLDSSAAALVPMKFGFSDDVRVYLNGVPLYEGSDRQNSRDYRFLGHAGFWDTAFLPLKAGANDVVLVVTDPTNGGTAAAAIVEPRAGLSVR